MSTLASSNVLVPQLGEFVIALVCFLVLLGLLYRTAYPRIRETYSERTEKIEGGLKRAEEAQREARETLERYRAQLREARHEANQIREEAREEGKRILAELRRQAEEDAERRKQRAEQDIRSARDRAVAELRGEVGSLAIALSQRILAQELRDPDRHRALIDDFISNLEAEGGGSDDGRGRERAESSSRRRGS